MNKENFFKWFKRGTLILAIIPILLFLGFAGAVSLIDFNQYKPQIEQEVAKVTGRDFKIEGAVEVSVLPFIFNIGQLYLRNSEGFTEETLLSVREVQIELSLVSLFIDKEISVISLELIEPKLHLIKTETGDNWSDIQLISQWLPKRPGLSPSPLLAHLPPTLSRDNHPPSASEWFDTLERVQVSNVAHQGLKPNFDWAFDSLVIRQGELQFEDQVAGSLAKLSAINILTFDVIKGQPFDVKSDFIYQNSASLRKYDFNLNSTLEISNHFQQWNLTNWDGLFTFHLPVEENVPAIRLTTSGERFELDLQTQNINVVKAKVAGLDAELTTSFAGIFGVNAALAGSVDLQGLNFKEWAYHLGLPMPVFIEQKALTQGNGQFEWQWDGQKLLLKEIELQIDQTQLKGSASYQIGQKPALEFDLNVDQLNLENYLATYQSPAETTRPGQTNLEQTQKSSQASPQKSHQKASEVIAKVSTAHYLPVGLPIENLRHLTASGQLTINQLSARDHQASSLQVTLLAEQGVLSFAPLDAELYQGELRSKFILDVTEEAPKYHWKGRLNQVDLQMAFASHVESPILDGVVTSRFNLRSKGLDNKAIKQNLNGLFSSELEQVKIEGLDLNQLLNGNMEVQTTSTLLDHVYLSGRWHQGVYSAKQFRANSERFSGSGSGSYDLNKDEIESQFLLAVEKPAEALSALEGFTVPLNYRGSLQSKGDVPSEKGVYTEPRWKVDMAQLMASPAYHQQQKQLITALSALFQ
ncbi:MAG: AsmA family protein [Pseudomonadota bacterium]